MAGLKPPTPDPKEAMANRYLYLRNALAEAPAATPGTKKIYGGSCILVVAYAEKKLNRPYEELMERYKLRDGDAHLRGILRGDIEQRRLGHGERSHGSQHR